MERLTIGFNSEYVPIGLCERTPFGDVDEVRSCDDCCESVENDCKVCAIQKCLNRLGRYENLHEKIIKRIKEEKEREDYCPGTHLAYLVQELEFALELVCKGEGGKNRHTVKIRYRDGRVEEQSVDEFGEREGCFWMSIKNGERTRNRYIPMKLIAECTVVENQ